MRVLGTRFVKVQCLSAGKGRKRPILGGKKARQKLRFSRWFLGGTVKVVKAKSAKLQGVRVRARARAPFLPLILLWFSFLFSLPFKSIKITVYNLKILQVFPRKLFHFTKTSLSPTRNLVRIEPKYVPIKQDIFSHKTQKTSEIIQKISNVFPKMSDVFLRISNVFN